MAWGFAPPQGLDFVNTAGATFAATTSYTLTTPKGAILKTTYLEEELTIAAAASTDSANSIPVNAVVRFVAVRVTTVIPGPATVFTVTGATSSTVFHVTSGGVLVAATTTDVGTTNSGYTNGATQKVRITPDANPGAGTGKVRITICYDEITAPTS